MKLIKNILLGILIEIRKTEFDIGYELYEKRQPNKFIERKRKIKNILKEKS